MGNTLQDKLCYVQDSKALHPRRPGSLMTHIKDSARGCQNHSCPTGTVISSLSCGTLHRQGLVPALNLHVQPARAIKKQLLCPWNGFSHLATRGRVLLNTQIKMRRGKNPFNAVRSRHTRIFLTEVKQEKQDCLLISFKPMMNLLC